MHNKQTIGLLLLFTILGACIHGYNLNWGAPYFFHPDERNIANAVSQLIFPTQLNPNFFAYGSLPIYAIYITGIISNVLKSGNLSAINAPLPFDQAILISRIYSAVFATLLIPLLFFIGRKIHSTLVGLTASFFTLTSTGIIQFSHFGTFEMWITLFSALLFFVCIKLIHKANAQTTILAAVITGILISVKVTNIVLIPLPLLAILSAIIPKPHQQSTHLKRIGKAILFISIFIGISIILYTITNPYAILDNRAFQNSMHYESSVALGTLAVFYTQEFSHTIPLIFQAVHVFPFLINPLLTMLLTPACTVFCFYGIKRKNREYLLLILFFLLLLFSQGFLFVKWTRYMVPTLPFSYLMIASLLSWFKTLLPNKKILLMSGTTIACLCFLYAFAYCNVVLMHPDSRLEAMQWLQKHLGTERSAITEPYDLGTMPISPVVEHLTYCNIYELETNPYPCNGQSLNTALQENNLVIIPSQRIYKTRISKPKEYPKGTGYYRALFSGQLGYHKVYETPCSLLCRILYLGNPVYSLEQTATVFDRPTVTIFIK